MQNRTQDRLAPLAVAHLMGRPGESTEEKPVRFRPQADRRQIEVLANGATDRRAKRTAAVSTNEGADVVNGTATSVSSDTARNE